MLYCHKSTVFIQPVILKSHHQSSFERQKALRHVQSALPTAGFLAKESLALLSNAQFQTLSTVLLSELQDSHVNSDQLTSSTFLLLLSPPLHSLSCDMQHLSYFKRLNKKRIKNYRFHCMESLSFMSHLILYIQLIAPLIPYQVIQTLFCCFKNIYSSKSGDFYRGEYFPEC